MDEPEGILYKTFGIYQHHLDYLKAVTTDNLNATLRNIIDSAIENEENNIKSQIFKDFSLYVVIIALGLVFFLFGMNYTFVAEMLLCYVIGLFMVIFGIVGGVLVALQSTKRNNR